ncbi:zinc finger protein 184-like isoform X2 [Pseudomyrmex gracilis]|uniref:zinc finger protein 184-like isoform X2 n=1 Tax=Pseudomyrmex gracilis TaxID=219809 RepID=UPI0009953823|nr:zinc finger protein 184-like isoform X2 [Pseudomyrmex gracilis]
MSGYRKVNYYELCRLCTSSEGTKINIFRDEGRRRQLQTKIQTYLQVQVVEEDSLPKIVCHECLKKLENFVEFREAVVTAEGMLESYFTSLRFSEDFLKEGKVYVKNIEKERSSTPDDEVLIKSIEKVSSPSGGQVISNDQQLQHQQPVVVGNLNASNIQIISGVQARVQQYKCAMQMQPGGMAAAVVEATAETHYSYQQQTSQVSSQQSNEAQNQIADQQNQSPAIQQQVQNQMQNHSQINQQVQGQPQISQQLQQLQRQQRELQQRQLQQLDKQQVQIITQQEFSVKQESPIVHQNNNVVLKTEADMEQNQQIIQKIQTETEKDESPSSGVQTFTTVQATPEVFLNLGFKDSPLTATVRDEAKEFKEFAKTHSEDGMSRNSIEQIREFLRIRSGTEPTSLITVTPQALTQTTRNNICRDCGKNFPTLHQMNNHGCNVDTLISETTDNGSKTDSLQNNVNNFSCDICNKPFKRKEHLLQHRKLHTGERPYVCTTCGKAFSRKEHLVRHSVSHTGQKVHECELCGKSFSRKDNLHKHRKTHGVSGPFICETCGKSFVVKHYYVMHLTTHTNNCTEPLPYKCDICDKAFSVKQYLTSHKIRHRSKNNNSAQNNLNGQQQSQQEQEAASNVVTSQDGGSLNNNNGQSSNESTVEIQSVIERNEQANGSFANSHYHANIQEYQ